MKLQFLSRRNHFTLLCYELKKMGFECHEIPVEKTRNFLSLPTCYYIKNIESDLFVTHNPYHGLFGADIAKKLKKTNHIVFRLKADHWKESKSKDIRLKNKFGFRLKNLQYYFSKKNVDVILAISNWMKNIAIENDVNKPIYTIYNGVDINRFDGNKIDESYSSEILSVMNFNIPDKIELIKEFLTYYKKSEIKYSITFLGDGIFFNEIQKHINSVGLKKKIRLKGWVDDPENYYSNTDLVIHPSNLESFGMSIIEAGASNIPVVAFKVGGIQETIEDGETGYLTTSIPEMVDKISALMESPEKRKEMGNNARKHIVENFSWKKIATEFVDVLTQENLLREE
jgi:glycosyltransferase involved in cell wall biosynthesis